MCEQEVVDEQKEVVMRVVAGKTWTAEGAIWSIKRCFLRFD